MEPIFISDRDLPHVRLDDKNERWHIGNLCFFGQSWLLALLIRLVRHFAVPAEHSMLDALLDAAMVLPLGLIAGVLGASGLGPLLACLFTKQEEAPETGVPISPAKFLWASLRWGLFWLVLCLGAAGVAFLILKGGNGLLRDCLQTIADAPRFLAQLRGTGLLLRSLVLFLEMLLLPCMLFCMLNLLGCFVSCLIRRFYESKGLLAVAMLCLLLLFGFAGGMAYLDENHKYIIQLLLIRLVPLGARGALNAILLAGGALIGGVAAIAALLFMATQAMLESMTKAD